METENKDFTPPLRQTDVSYSEFITKQDQFNMDKAMKEYADYENAEIKRITKVNDSLLEILKYQLPKNYFKAIIDFLHDSEHGIWGELKIVDKPIGGWQDEINEYTEADDYWNELKGMYVNQSCGYSGDDYSGTLEIKIDSNRFLRCPFSL